MIPPSETASPFSNQQKERTGTGKGLRLGAIILTALLSAVVLMLAVFWAIRVYKSYSGEYRAAIIDVMRQHQAVVKDYQGELAKIHSNDANAVLDGIGKQEQQLVMKARDIDLSGCPYDFRQPFRKYITLRSELSETLVNHPQITDLEEASIGALIVGLLSRDTNEVLKFGSGVIQSNAAFCDTLRIRKQAVDTAFDDILDVAGQYAVRPKDISSP